ncbi:TetR/AcrR family transcriptional regulator [Saccharopolyspora sp. 5N708]|uniref:TetR/AcrR family transcriptional regulator n=1 Tax=Saccharopolyspora sp. 5N708 TaxID=3457424 RepID=UPI003FD35F13
MGRTAELLERLTPAGRRVLDVAADLFYRQGIHAVGVEAIAAEAGVTKKTLYACFGSKDQLVTAYLTERDQRWRVWLLRWIAEHATSPREELLAVFDALEAWMDREDFRGCGFVNALAEIPESEHPARAVIIGQKRWMREYFEQLAAAAGVGNAADFADSALLLYEGATVAASADITGAAQQARNTAAALLAV